MVQRPKRVPLGDYSVFLPVKYFPATLLIIKLLHCFILNEKLIDWSYIEALLSHFFWKALRVSTYHLLIVLRWKPVAKQVLLKVTDLFKKMAEHLPFTVFNKSSVLWSLLLSWLESHSLPLSAVPDTRQVTRIKEVGSSLSRS